MKQAQRLAIVAAVLTWLLLTVGGIVTSREAGMVFPDWPLSNGSVNPPGWLRDADMTSEHGHRILGALVGLATVLLAVRLQRTDGRRFVRVLGWVAVVAVVLQGVLGGLRVTEISGELALLHGCLGQLFFCLVVALAYLCSRDAARAPEDGPETGGLAVCAGAVWFTLLMQVVLGAQLRHHQGPLQAHYLGALAVTGVVFWLLALAMLRHPGRRALQRPVLLLAGLLLVQISLGLVTAGVLRGYDRNAITPAQVLLPTAHQSLGALMLATSTVVCLRALRRLSALPARGAEVAV